MRLGILGGGQLARMMAFSCHSLGIEPYVVSDKANNPCNGLSNILVSSYSDIPKIVDYLKNCTAITYEFENIPLDLVSALMEGGKVSPSTKALSTTRERKVEKSFARDLGILVPDFLYAESPEELLEISKEFSFPAVLKTNTSGYDGKGQWMFDTWNAFSSALSEIPAVSLVLEKKINFEREFSIIGVRNSSGEVRYYDPCENTHSKGILIKTLVGSIDRGSEVFKIASSYVKLLLEALDYVGVLSVEFFQQGDSIIFNEYAPRVHNSGHWTIEGAHCSQFENHVRAVIGLPLGSTQSICPSLMLNLLGTTGRKEDLLKIPKLHYHWYGKHEVSGRRKVGHLTILGDSINALGVVEKLASNLT